MRCWPIIRHVRYFILKRRTDAHYDLFRHAGYLPVNAGSDYAVLDMIWRGKW